MDDKKRQSLIKTFADAKNFDSTYSQANRLWFVDKLIRGLESEGLADPAIENMTRDVVTAAKPVGKANRYFSLTITASGNPRFTKRALQDMLKHRVEILYGTISFNRRFIQPQNLKYLLFVAKRRFRAVCRMYFWVNPNGQGYFRYPHQCKTNQHWRVNEDAE